MSVPFVCVTNKEVQISREDPLCRFLLIPEEHATIVIAWEPKQDSGNHPTFIQCLELSTGIAGKSPNH